MLIKNSSFFFWRNSFVHAWDSRSEVRVSVVWLRGSVILQDAWQNKFWVCQLVHLACESLRIGGSILCLFRVLVLSSKNSCGCH